MVQYSLLLPCPVHNDNAFSVDEDYQNNDDAMTTDSDLDNDVVYYVLNAILTLSLRVFTGRIQRHIA